MKTLKLQLLAVALLACGTAFAQGTAAGQTNGPANTTNNPNGGLTPNGTTPRASYGEDSYVLQRGDNQYANVDQTGYQNTADIYQGQTAGAASSGNNAYQTQYNPYATPRNVAYIDQEGLNSTAIQNQAGSGNRANIIQGPGVMSSYAEQLQSGQNNSADTRQTDTRTTAFSFTQQSGNNNQVIVSQHP